eukprot:9489475-Pyramimonas_sp.AAC.1
MTALKEIHRLKVSIAVEDVEAFLAKARPPFLQQRADSQLDAGISSHLPSSARELRRVGPITDNDG